MVERPDFNYDNAGAPIAPAAPSPQEVVTAVERGDPPTAEQQRALGVEPTSPPTVPAKLERDAKGNIIRPDWNQKPLAVHSQDGLPVKRKSIDGIMREDWDKPRDERGRYITTSDADLRQRWEREGGYEFNMARARETTRAIVELAGDDGPGLIASVDALPSEVQPLIHDLLRLQPTGNAATTDRIIEDRFRRLPRQHMPAVKAWWDALTENQVVAIYQYFDGKRK